MGLSLAWIVPIVVRRSTTIICGKTWADLVAIECACEEFFLANGRYPTDLEELACPDAEGRSYLPGTRDRLDVWGRPYSYVRPLHEASKPRIYTLGRDGEPGGAGEDADFSSLEMVDRHGKD